MPKGLALTIGLNSVDPKHYGGWSGDLNACEADAEDMADISKSKKFKVKTLLTKSATRKNVLAEISKAAKVLNAGDIFMLSYSGHGGQLPDMNDDEPDSQDETWCLFDGELVDDELYTGLGKFKPDVRVLVFSDSCHSGTVVKMAYYQKSMITRDSSPGVRYRCMPPDAALRTYRNNRSFYDSILANKAITSAPEKVKASILLISGCQDNQLSSDGDFNGLFTSQLLKVWKNGAFKDNYKKFHSAIVRRMPPDQTPKYFRAGSINSRFEAQIPFTV
ncbi:MAG TPA: caspase family protein [Thermodesulfovibrionales bacterium]|nr:caspase family protein [Thermodesulfovibrionales bacterium]